MASGKEILQPGEEESTRVQRPKLPKRQLTASSHPSCEEMMVRAAAKKKMMLRDRSTTPRSARGMDPDEYDRMMGISSVHPSEGDRFGDGDTTDTKEIEEGAANDSLSSTPNWSPIVSGLVDCPGADLDSRVYGSASFMECLDRSLGRVPSLAAPTACASEGAAEYFRSQPNPRQVMSPNSSQTLSQDPFPMQVPKPEADANVMLMSS